MLKCRDITLPLPIEVCIVKAVVFPVVMYGCGSWAIKEGWATKKWCFGAMVLEKTLESPLGHKNIIPVSPKGNQSWIFIGRTDAEAPVLWPPNAKSRFIGKDSDAGKDWRQEEKGMTEDEMVGLYNWFDGHEFEPTPGDSEGPGSLGCWSPWSKRVRHDWVTE